MDALREIQSLSHVTHGRHQMLREMTIISLARYCARIEIAQKASVIVTMTLSYDGNTKIPPLYFLYNLSKKFFVHFSFS